MGTLRKRQCMGQIRYFSTFTGIGGMELGIQQAYESNNEHAYIGKEPEQKERPQGRVRAADKHRVQLHTRNRSAPLCVGYSEIDPYAIQIYEKFYPTHKNYGDITAINEKELPDFDLLVGGFPCQAFSIAGKRGGFEDTRGTLFFDLARILREKQPRLCMFENVKGLLSHDQGRTFTTIITTLDELGYDVQWQVINSKNHGVPQNRERIFIIGHLRGTSRPEVFPLGSSDAECAPEANEQGCSSTLTGRSAGGQNRRGNYIVQLNEPIHSNDRVYSPEGISPTLNTMQGGARQPFVALGGDGSTKNQATNADGVRTSAGIPGPVDGIGISDTQRYKTLGNAVTVNVIRDITMRLLAEA